MSGIVNGSGGWGTGEADVGWGKWGRDAVCAWKGTDPKWKLDPKDVMSIGECNVPYLTRSWHLSELDLQLPSSLLESSKGSHPPSRLTWQRSTSAVDIINGILIKKVRTPAAPVLR